MSQKKPKIAHAHDAIVKMDHIQTAQHTMLRLGHGAILKQVFTVEPELTSFITAAAKEIAAGTMIDCDMPRSVAQHLRERVAALALTIYGTYNLAIYDHYKDLFKGTAVAALDAEPEPAPPSAQMPPNAEEGGLVSPDADNPAAPQNPDPENYGADKRQSPINPFEAARMRPPSPNICVEWSVHDMLRPDWSQRQCESFLRRHAAKFAAGMIRMGLTVLASMADDPQFGGSPSSSKPDEKTSPPES